MQKLKAVFSSIEMPRRPKETSRPKVPRGYLRVGYYVERNRLAILKSTERDF